MEEPPGKKKEGNESKDTQADEKNNDPEDGDWIAEEWKLYK